MPTSGEVSAIIDKNIKTNGVGAISGALLNEVLKYLLSYINDSDVNRVSFIETKYGDAGWVNATTYNNPSLKGKTFFLQVLRPESGGNVNVAELKSVGSNPEFSVLSDGGFTLNAGFEAQAGSWYRILGVGVAPAGVLSTQSGPQDLAIVDSNGYVFYAFNKGVQSWPPIENEIGYSDLSSSLQKLFDTVPYTNTAPHIGLALVDDNGLVFSAILKNGSMWPPLEVDASSSVVTTSSNTAWKNYYPNLLSKKPVYTNKLLGNVNSTIEDYIKIIVWSDSILIREMHTSIGKVIPSAYPPSLVTQNAVAYLWQSFVNAGYKVPQYRRYDFSPSPFVETGAYTTVTTGTGWDDTGDRPNATRRTIVPLATLAFTIEVGCDYFNLIDRTTTDADSAIAIAITGGNGLVQVRLPDSTVWVEANGAVLSQLEPAATSRKGSTTFQRRVEFKKLNSANTATVTFTKSNNAAPFYYWGLEKVMGAPKPYIQLINIGRGGHTQAELNAYIENDVTGRKPDLIIWEVPITNMYGTDKSISYNVNAVWDTLFGDRPGATNTWNLKNQSANFTKFDVIIVLPHITQGNYNTDSTLKEDATTGNTQVTVRNAMKQFLISRGFAVDIDMYAAFTREIQNDPDFDGKRYEALAASSPTGITYLNDATHQNDKGTLVYARHICPALTDLNTY